MKTETTNILRSARLASLTTLAVTITVWLITWLLPTTAHPAASVHSSARSAAMGGAFTALAKGVDAAKYNPANLGLDGYSQRGIELASFGASITNNSFTLSDYNRYSGAVLSTADKQDILEKIPTEGLSIDADIKASALSFSTGSFALSFSGVGAADINLNRDVIDLIFNGNTFADTIDVSGSYSDAVSYGAVSLSYGRSIYASGTRQLAVGITASYYHGIAVEELVELEGLAATYATGFQGSGAAVIRTATGGSGFGIDLGAALKLNDTYTAGVRLENLIGSINWKNNPEEIGYTFEFDTTTIENIDNDLVTSNDYTKEIAAFSTSLPSVMNIGFAKTSGKLLWAIDWTQGFRSAPGSSTKPRLALGGEYQVLSFAPLRAGFMTGGDRNTAFSFGSGVKLYGVNLDLAIITGSSLSVYSAKGANVALSTGIQF